MALVLICLAGVITAGDRFASIDNMLTILRLASTIGVVSIGMTFVITGGGIDLSVGAILALCSVWATTFATQTMAEDTHWADHGLRRARGRRGLRPRQRGPHRLRQGRPLHHHAGDARGSARAWPRSSPSGVPRSCAVDGFKDFFSADIAGVPVIVIIFALVSAVGWVLFNRTTFGRRTLAVGGSPEAARLAGINVNRHTVMLYVLVGLCCGIAALMLVSPHVDGQLDARPALRARRHRRRRHRRHAALRRPGHHRRHRRSASSSSRR